MHYDMMEREASETERITPANANGMAWFTLTSTLPRARANIMTLHAKWKPCDMILIL